MKIQRISVNKVCRMCRVTCVCECKIHGDKKMRRVGRGLSSCINNKVTVARFAFEQGRSLIVRERLFAYLAFTFIHHFKSLTKAKLCLYWTSLSPSALTSLWSVFTYCKAWIFREFRVFSSNAKNT